MQSYIVNEEAVYCAIGEMTVKFQLLENELREISWFCAEPTDATAGPTRGFGRIVDHAKKAVSAYLDRSGVAKDAAIRSHFAAAFQRCRDVATRRNRAVHSLYRHYETLHGKPMLVRTWTEKARQGSIEIKNERVTEATITSVLQDLKVAYEAMFGLHRQLMYSLQTILARGEGRPTILTS